MTAPLPPAPRGAWSWTGIADVIRLPFLPLAALLVLTGTALQSRVHAVSWGAAALAAAGLVAMHAAVNALNELSDYRTGIDLHTERTPFSGGSGALPAGRLSLRATWVVAAVSLTTAALVALVLLPRGGYPLLAVLVAGLALTLSYTPWGTRSGVGEVAAGLGLGTLLRYMSGRLTLVAAIAHLGRLAGLNAAAISTPFGLAAVDVDKPADLDLVRDLIARP